jgi:hypothetical protein
MCYVLKNCRFSAVSHAGNRVFVACPQAELCLEKLHPVSFHTALCRAQWAALCNLELALKSHLCTNSFAIFRKPLSYTVVWLHIVGLAASGLFCCFLSVYYCLVIETGITYCMEHVPEFSVLLAWEAELCLEQWIFIYVPRCNLELEKSAQIFLKLSASHTLTCIVGWQPVDYFVACRQGFNLCLRWIFNFLVIETASSITYCIGHVHICVVLKLCRFSAVSHATNRVFVACLQAELCFGKLHPVSFHTALCRAQWASSVQLGTRPEKSFVHKFFCNFQETTVIHCSLTAYSCSGSQWIILLLAGRVSTCVYYGKSWIFNFLVIETASRITYCIRHVHICVMYWKFVDFLQFHTLQTACL